MNKQEILDFIRGCQFCFLATVEDGTPHARGMMPYRIDENGFIFHTGKMKDLYKQLLKNPEVELCFFSPVNNTQVRVNGTAEILEDINLKKEIVGKRDFLKPWIQKIGYEPFVVFKVKNCAATVWTMATNFSPKEYVKLY